MRNTSIVLPLKPGEIETERIYRGVTDVSFSSGHAAECLSCGILLPRDELRIGGGRRTHAGNILLLSALRIQLNIFLSLSPFSPSSSCLLCLHLPPFSQTSTAATRWGWNQGRSRRTRSWPRPSTTPAGPQSAPDSTTMKMHGRRQRTQTRSGSRYQIRVQ